MRKFAPLVAILFLVGCGLKPSQVAPAVTSIAAITVAFAPDLCEEIPFQDIRDAGQAVIDAADTVEAMCSSSENPQFQ